MALAPKTLLRMADRFERAVRRREFESDAFRFEVDLNDVHVDFARDGFRTRDVGHA